MKTAFNNLKSNVIFLLLCGLTMLLLARGTLYALPEVLWALPALFLLIIAAKAENLLSFRHTDGYFPPLCAGICAALSGADLFSALESNETLGIFSAAWSLPYWLLRVVPALLLAGLSFFTYRAVFVWVSLQYKKAQPSTLPTEVSPDTRKSNDRRTDFRAFLYCLLTAFVVLTICTKSSFLYPFNDWVDANCFFTVGKSMAEGKVLYRDIYEQKGILLYVLHALAYRISADTFFGVYLLEVLAGALFLFFAYKTVRLYARRGILFWLPWLGALIYASASFCHGDSAEELCMPILTACIYLSERSFRRGKTLSFWNWFVAGVLGGCVLWIKFNLLGFFVGWALVPLYRTLRDKGFLPALRAVAGVLLGVLVPSVPVLVYFLKNDAISDLWTAYFYNNIFLYSAAQDEGQGVLSLLQMLYGRVRIFMGIAYPFAVPAFIGIVWYSLVSPAKYRLSPVFAALLLVPLIFSGSLNLMYYWLAFAPFAVYGLLLLCILTDRFLQKDFRRVTAALTVVSLLCAGLFSWVFSSNTYLMQYEKEDMPQYQFKEIILSVDDPSLLNYGFLDGGFYTVCNLVPECKYFCTLNIPLEDMFEAMDMQIALGLPDFVVTRSTPLVSENYICVASANMYFEGVDFDYYLYASVRVVPQLVDSGVLA